MEHSSSSMPPTSAYDEENALPDYRWRIRNTKICSQFSTTTPAHVSVYREHIERMKDPVFQQHFVKGSAPGTHKETGIVDVHYSQAFADIGRLIYEYKDKLDRIQPLQEEEVLFLLLSRYAQASGTEVYLEIRRPGDVQVYGSSIPNPLQTSTLANHSLQTSCTVTANMDTPHMQRPGSSRHMNGLNGDLYDIPIPASPSAVNTECSVTMNFPEMFLVAAYGLSLSGNSLEDPLLDPIFTPDTTFQGSAREARTPVFCLNRCNHRGVELGDRVKDFKLPLGFTKVLQHIHETPPVLDFYRASYYIDDNAKVSFPRKEKGIQAFQCRLLPAGVDIFITIERQGGTLVYDCFRDEEAWAAFHQHYKGCTECIGVMKPRITNNESSGARARLGHDGTTAKVP